jgi:hypothetical protein
MRLLAVAVLSLAVGSSACRRADGPAERYRAFAAAVRGGDAAAVWSMLSRRTRAAFDARAKALAAAAPAGVVSASGEDLVLGDLAVRSERPRSVVVVRESRGAAVVSVEIEGGGPAREVTLVREEGAWRVVVPFDN